MDKRRKPRQPRRLSCALWIDGKRHTGFVKDVSEDGIYVQTRARAAVGCEVELVFAPEAGRRELRVHTRVARLHRLSAHLATSGAGGLGLSVVNPPRGLAPLLVSAGFRDEAPAAKAAKS